MIEIFSGSTSRFCYTCGKQVLMQQHRLIHIDGLRGIAALVVMLSHFLCAFYPAFQTVDSADVQTASRLEMLITPTPFNILYNGNFAVCLFFVISGYVLSYAYFQTREQEFIFSSAFRRYPRLIIPVLATSVLYFIFIRIHLFPTVQTAAITHSKWLARMFNFTPDWLEMLWNSTVELTIRYTVETPYNPVLWTIGHEIRGSFLVYFCLFLFGNRSYRWIFYLLFSILLIKSYYILFIAGIMLCDLHHGQKLAKPNMLIKSMLLIVACWFGSYRLLPDHATWKLLDPLCSIVKPTAIGAILLFYVFILSPGVHSVLSNKAFKFLGDVSYSLYLIHLFVLCSMACYLFTWLHGSLLLPYHIAFWITFICSATAIFSLSLLLYRSIDKQGIRFSKWFYHKLFR
jgi:peptidoglycan/LPS O-acetylase OafA/YrhL